MANGNGRHLCLGTNPPKIREYASGLCSNCQTAVELPEDEDIPIPGGEGAVRDKRRFTHYLEKETKP